jgi:predicted RNase H-like nuclease
LTHPEISFELLDAKYMLVEIKVTNESTNAESEIERVENFLILQAYAF